MNTELIRKRQSRLLDMCYQAMRSQHVQAQAEFNRLYDETVTQLQAVYGVDGDCWLVDMELWERYSDAHKDRYGVRGRAVMSREETQAWLDWYRDTPEDEF